MKKIILFLFLSFCLTSQAFAMTYTNEPKEYDGVPWGSSVSDFNRYGKQITLVKQEAQENVSVYKPENQSLFIFNKNFDEINYYFYKGRFFMVRAIKHNDKEMSQTLYQTIKSRHGAHTQQNDNIPKKTTTYWWQGDNTFILLTMDHMQQNTHLTFYNKALYQEWSFNRKPTTGPPGKIKERS